MERSIITVALCSRLIICSIQCISNLLIPDHDAGVFLYPKGTESKLVFDKLTEGLLGGLLRWDAQYFMHVAKYGYTYEHTLAFFPLLPLSARFFSIVTLKLLPFFSVDTSLLICFTLLNFILFCLSALTLYELTLQFFNQDFAYKTALLFCFNPASIFFTAPYTECLFSYLSFRSMLNCVILYQKYSLIESKFSFKDILLLNPIAFSCITRSNGILNIGFFLYTCFCLLVQTKDKILKNIICYFPTILIGTLYCLFPFICFQYYAYQKFCTDHEEAVVPIVQDHAIANNFILPGQFTKHSQNWCFHIIPLSYSYIQAKYWDVGFMKYYKLKQIPNFFLAFPILMISLNYVIRFLYRNLKLSVKRLFTFTTYLHEENINVFHPVLFVYIVHLLGLTLFSLVFIHIQVTTRMLLSASPVVYWYCAYQFLSIKVNGNGINDLFIIKTRNVTQLFIKYYFLLYYILGTILFSNYFPWT